VAVWLFDSEKKLKICLLFSTQYMNMTDGQTYGFYGLTSYDSIGQAYA